MKKFGLLIMLIGTWVLVSLAQEKCRGGLYGGGADAAAGHVCAVLGAGLRE